MIQIDSIVSYEWGYVDSGGLWRDLPTMHEFVFRTYGYS